MAEVVNGNGITSGPLWVKVAFIYGPMTVVAGVLVWFLLTVVNDKLDVMAGVQWKIYGAIKGHCQNSAKTDAAYNRCNEYTKPN